MIRGLEEERARFRSGELSPEAELWPKAGRIGVVLSGGGARGAYEAGVLLAFQDAQMPTHILAATSVGSINAASYAAHSSTVVGNAESLVRSWADVTPPTVGIEWYRYILLLGGLTAMTAGVGNLIRDVLAEQDVFVHVIHPKLMWLALSITGFAFLYFHDQVSYLGHVIKNALGHRNWKPDRVKVLRSILGNLIVWGCVLIVLGLSHLHMAALEIIYVDDVTQLMLLAALVLTVALNFLFRQQISVFSHKFLRLPLRTGLFPNFERTRFLRERIPAAGLESSPIRVVMTAAHVNEGRERCFVNATHAELIGDPGANRDFVTQETVRPVDPLLAVIASSAFPIVYETVPAEGGNWTDGGIVGNQPIRPAIRLGADVLFLVLVEPREQRRGEIKTFLDMGVRAIDILMSQNLRTDLKMLNSVNAMCAHYAQQLGLRPEEVVLSVGDKQYHYLKAITIEPQEPIAAAVLDFDGALLEPAILAGYRDGSKAVGTLRDYLRALPVLTRQEVKLQPAVRAAAASGN